MVDLSIAGSAISSVKTLYDIANGMLAMNKDIAVNSKATELLSTISEIQGRLLETQQVMAQMQEELRKANEELSRRAQFDRYELSEPFKGTRLYRLKADATREGEPVHFICPNCEDVLNKLSILQEDGSSAYCKNKDCGQVFDIAPPPTFERKYQNPYVV